MAGLQLQNRKVGQVWTPLKGAVQPYVMLCRADGLKLYDDNGVHLKLGILMQPRSILNPVKTSGGQPVALEELRCLAWRFFFWPVLIRLGVFPALKRYFSSIRNFSSIQKVFFQHLEFFQHLKTIFSSI